MATVYKIEVEAVSHWINFPTSDIEERIKKAIEKEFSGEGTTDYPEHHNEFDVGFIEVERIA